MYVSMYVVNKVRADPNLIFCFDKQNLITNLVTECQIVFYKNLTWRHGLQNNRNWNIKNY